MKSILINIQNNLIDIPLGYLHNEHRQIHTHTINLNINFDGKSYNFLSSTLIPRKINGRTKRIIEKIK